jgi:hypothetical protein
MFAVLNGDYSVFKSALSVDEFLDDPMMCLSIFIEVNFINELWFIFQSKKMDGNYIL